MERDVDGGCRWWHRFTPWRKRGSWWFCGAQSFFGLIMYATESGGVRGIINVVKETEAKMAFSLCVS
jgi:hypothetical protein